MHFHAGYHTPARKSSLTNLLRPMIFTLALAAGLFASAACRRAVPQTLPTLTETAQVRALSAQEAARGYPVSISGWVTYSDPAWNLFFIEDASGGMLFTQGECRAAFSPGYITVRGRTSSNGQVAFVVAEGCVLSAAPAQPAAESAEPPHIALGEWLKRRDWRFFETTGVVRDVDLKDGQQTLLLAAGGHKVNVRIKDWHSPEIGLATRLPGALVRVRGVCGPATRGAQVFSGPEIYVQLARTSIAVERPANQPARLPLLTADSLRPELAQEEFVRRVRLRGEVVRQELGESLTLRSAGGEIMVLTKQPTQFRAGETIDVYGFPTLIGGHPALDDAQAHRADEPVAADSFDPLYVQSVKPPAAQVLTTIRQIHELSPAVACLNLPVRITGVVTVFDAGVYRYFVQDATGGIYVSGWGDEERLEVGQRVELEGSTNPGAFSPIIIKKRVRVLGRGALPRAAALPLNRLLSSKHDGLLVEIEGDVRSVKVASERLVLTLAVGSERMGVMVGGAWRGNLPYHLIDAHVRVRGVWSPNFNARRQLINVYLFAPSFAQVEVVEPPPHSNFEALPLMPIRSLRQYHPTAANDRVRVRGQVTLQLADGHFYMRDDLNGLHVRPISSVPLYAGDKVEVTGFPVFVDGSLMLNDATVRRLGAGTEAAPFNIGSAADALDIAYDGQLIRLEAYFTGRIPTDNGYSYLMGSNGVIFTVHLNGHSATDRLASLQIGSVVALTGVCRLQYAQAGEGIHARSLPQSFSLLLSGPEAVRVVSLPSWWTVKRALWLLAVAVAAVALGAAWLIVLRRRARRQTEIIREKLQHEAALEHRYEKLFENAKDAVYTHDLQGRFTSINRAGELLTGYSREEFLQLSAEQLVAPGYFTKMKEVLAHRLTDRLPTAAEIEIVTKDGTRVPVEVSATLLDDGGEAGVLGIVRDITARKQVEAERQRARDEALQHSRLKSEFLANMSHEIRTPMNGIIGMTELALETTLTPDQRDFLSTVKSSADALLGVINDILDFSKIEAGKLDLDPVDFNLHDCLHDAVKPLALRAAEKQLELVCEIAPGVPEAVVGDPLRLRQVVANLIGNAIKFTKEGEVVIEVRRAEGGRRNDSAPSLQHSSPGAAQAVLHFTVRDTGIGIAPDKLERIFQAFTQADGSTTREYGGTGLGLTISKRLVEMMGGRMWAESEEGRGSCFHFTAVFGVRSDAAVRCAPAEVERLRGLRVLVVDDNATNRRVLEMMAASWGMRPTSVEGVHAALDRLTAAHAAGVPYDLALLDVHMPVADGFMLAEQVRQRPEFSGLKLVMLTSAGQRGGAARCRELGISAYLTKPVKKSELLAAICTLYGEASPAAPPSATLPVPLVPCASAAPGAGLRVLLAEDNFVNQKLARRLLERRGCRVVTVGNGREAVEAVASEQFDLVLMDVQMPEMDGFEATAAIRLREAAIGGHVPIIAITAHAMKGDDERCLAAGMDGYIAKPIKSEELYAMIERLARGVGAR